MCIYCFIKYIKCVSPSRVFDWLRQTKKLQPVAFVLSQYCHNKAFNVFESFHELTLLLGLLELTRPICVLVYHIAIVLDLRTLREYP